MDEVVSTSSRMKPSGLSSVRVRVLVLVECSVASDVADRQNEVAGFVDVVHLLPLLITSADTEVKKDDLVAMAAAEVLLVVNIGCTTNEWAGHNIITMDNNAVNTAGLMVVEETMVVVKVKVECSNEKPGRCLEATESVKVVTSESRQKEPRQL